MKRELGDICWYLAQAFMALDTDFNEILEIIKSNNIDMVIVGPEEPLVNGIVDFLNKNKIKVLGPNKYASQLEGSKAFMKDLCKKKKQL